ncbi:MAG: gliding motility-associated C-terminal domain-containing protein, partial [Bacteroidia bacterium]
VQNDGQFEKEVLFRVQLNTGYVFLERHAITFKLFNEKEYHKAHQHIHKDSLVDNSLIHGHTFKYKFYNCKSNIAVNGQKPFKEKFNYFLGNNKTKWASNVPVYSEVIYTNVYEGIDLKVYSKFGQIKYEWIVSPNTNALQIGVEIEGLDSVLVMGNNLLLHTSIGIFRDKNLEVFQPVNSLNKTSLSQNIKCNYQWVNNLLSFKFPEGYNHEQSLIIDPILVFSTYSGSRGDNFGYTATFDLRGNLYAGGITDNSHGEYPVTVGAFQTVCKGGKGLAPVLLPCDITISKYDSSGKTLLYATYIGGVEDDYPHSMVVNGDTELVVFGTTYSNDFPMNANGYDLSHNSYAATNGFTDIVIFKLSKNGDQLKGSTFFGGNNHDGLTDAALRYNYADQFRGEVLTDKADNIYVVSGTNSNNIPLKNATKSSLEGPADGLCLKFSKNLDQLLWSTYFGGNGSDGIYSLEFDKNENIYVAGGTLSTNLPTHSGAINKNNIGLRDGFMAAFTKNTFALDKATYYGTDKYDQIYFLEIDKAGYIYATGQTEGDISASQGVYSNKANTGQFILMADAGLNIIKKQTVFGNRPHNPEISPSAFLVDSCGNIYLSGWGSNLGDGYHIGTTNRLPITNNALQSVTDNNDFYLAVFGKNLSSLLFATYFGGNKSDDHVDGGTSRFDKRGVIYQSVCSSCPDEPGATISDFPTTSNAAFPKNVSWRCSNAAFKIDFQINNLVKAKFIPDATACGPAEVQFTNQSNGNGHYIWDFGDSKSSTDKHPKHNFPKVGTYKILLTAIDSNTCNLADTTSRIVNIVQRSDANFEIKQFKCTSQIELINKSSDFETSTWDFGDSTSSGINNPGIHEYKNPGFYKIILKVDTHKQCPDTVEVEVEIKGAPADKLIPLNVFTPDGDGLNDCFHFGGGLNECSEFKLTIFNRWGQKMFETKDFYECWNGCVNNSKKICPEGTYLYICEYKGESDKVMPRFSGTVTLIRK